MFASTNYYARSIILHCITVTVCNIIQLYSFSLRLRTTSTRSVTKSCWTEWWTWERKTAPRHLTSWIESELTMKLYFLHRKKTEMEFSTKAQVKQFLPIVFREIPAQKMNKINSVDYLTTVGSIAFHAIPCHILSCHTIQGDWEFGLRSDGRTIDRG